MHFPLLIAAFDHEITVPKVFYMFFMLVLISEPLFLLLSDYRDVSFFSRVHL